jgi:hypothetical protein
VSARGKKNSHRECHSESKADLLCGDSDFPLWGGSVPRVRGKLLQLLRERSATRAHSVQELVLRLIHEKILREL